ncbi:hypothetical protein QAD02_009011 [Eretmocerus hayati]|uniref:Uncharacterized protein n=1 Tax=Eretmocerus hayati TaxID=131215 RepID=A0ACC2N8G6_9HYME|nr:hypothetical protein QAD02_009011 [Eretmocerus hayati]
MNELARHRNPSAGLSRGFSPVFPIMMSQCTQKEYHNFVRILEYVHSGVKSALARFLIRSVTSAGNRKMPLAQVIGDTLVIDNFTYERCDSSHSIKRSSDDEDDMRTYWRCRSRNEQGKKCRAGAITDGIIRMGMPINAKQISRGSGHNHLPPSQPHNKAAQNLIGTSPTSPEVTRESSPKSSSFSNDADEVQNTAEASPLQLEKLISASADSVEVQDVLESTASSIYSADELHPEVEIQDELQHQLFRPNANSQEKDTIEFIEDIKVQQACAQGDDRHISGEVMEMHLTQQRSSLLVNEMLSVELKEEHPTPVSSPTVLQQENPLRIRIQGLTMNPSSLMTTTLGTSQQQNYMPTSRSTSHQYSTQPTSNQQPSVPFDFTKAVKSSKRQISYGGFAKDAHRYHRFLVELTRNPLFLKENIMKALGVVYRTKFAVMAAYVTILENKDRIMNDLDALMNDPNVTIYSLHGQSNSSMRSNPLMKDILDSDKILTCLKSSSKRGVPCDDEASCDCVKHCSRPAKRSKHCSRPAKRSRGMEQNGIIPPVPSAIPMESFMPVKRFVPYVDLENGYETLLDLSNGVKFENDQILSRGDLTYLNIQPGTAKHSEDFNHTLTAAYNQLCNRFIDYNSNSMSSPYPLELPAACNNNASPYDQLVGHNTQPTSRPNSRDDARGSCTPNVQHQILCFVQKCDRASEPRASNMQSPTQGHAIFNRMQQRNQISVYDFNG